MNSGVATNAVDDQLTKNGTRPGMGPGGKYKCINCATTIAHRQGILCREEVCPVCVSRMRRR